MVLRVHGDFKRHSRMAKFEWNQKFYFWHRMQLLMTKHPCFPKAWLKYKRHATLFWYGWIIWHFCHACSKWFSGLQPKKTAFMIIGIQIGVTNGQQVGSLSENTFTQFSRKKLSLVKNRWKHVHSWGGGVGDGLKTQIIKWPRVLPTK